MARLLAVTAALALLATGCPEDEPAVQPPAEPPADTPADTPVAAPEEWASCTNPEDGYTAEYPAGWVVNTDHVDELPPCSLFDPADVSVQGMEVPFSIAVFLRVHAVEFERVTEDDPFAEELDRRAHPVGDCDGLRVEFEHTGEAMAPAGMVSTAYWVDLGGETFSAKTHDVGDLDYAEKQNSLDEMMDRIELEPC
jgi:hypothetical protein